MMVMNSCASALLWSYAGAGVRVCHCVTRPLCVCAYMCVWLCVYRDTVTFATTEGLVRFVGGLVLIPLWRDVHFYFAHRLLHFGPLYQQVHSLHHRNTDPEPFSGRFLP